MSASVYIYLITNLVNGKQYVGQTINLEERESSHRRANGGCPAIHNAIRKYGWDNFSFDVVFEHDDERFAIEVMEPLFIEWFDTFENGYNLTLGGDGGRGSERAPITEDTRQKMSESAKRRRGEKRSNAARQNIAQGQIGRKHSEITKQKMSAAKVGKTLSNEHKQNISDAIKGKKKPPFSDEHKKRLRESWKRRKARQSLSATSASE
jgi:group I intron endonuclease